MGRARGTGTLAAAKRRQRTAGGPVRRWTDEVIRAELEAFLDGRADWPTAEEFVAAGRHDLREAVKRLGGAAWWAGQLGVALRPGQDRAPYGDEDALRDARALLRRFGQLPGPPRARELGYARFASYVQRRGGSRAFAQRHSLPGSLS